jgi:hypothetical protein
MGWIKRNLFFVIGLAIAVVLLALAVAYDLQSWSHNSTAKSRLNEAYRLLGDFAGQKPLPGDGVKVDNIKIATTQEQQMREWISRSGNYFQPIAPIPGGFGTPGGNGGRMGGRGNGGNGGMSSEVFKNALDRTISQMQHEAAGAGVQLPPDYGFSFTAQRIRVQFAPGSLEPLALQLGEVKTISEILFAARVNSLESIQRVRVSDDDTAAGSQADYVTDTSTTNDFAIITPCAVTFRSFSSEIASVLAGFASSPHGFIVKGINVSPAGTVAPPTAPPAAGRGGLPTVLNEQLLRVTLRIEIVRRTSR